MSAPAKFDSNQSVPKPPPDARVAAALNAGAVVACRHCERSNPASRRFCAACGKSLWEQCPQCKAECAADERFCGVCGTDIHGGYESQNQQYAARLDEARAHAANYRFDAALDALQRLAVIDDPRFATWSQQAREEIPRVQNQRSQHRTAAEQAFDQSRKAMEAHAYDAARRAIGEVPEALRTSEMRELLERAQWCSSEVASLGAEIRTALEERQTADLLPKLGRLLALRPGHAQAEQFAAQIRDQLARQAKKQLGEHNYHEAAEALEQIPAFIRTDDVEALADKANELVSLLDDARLSALADKPALTLVEKLAKIAATNVEAIALRDQLRDRTKARSADPRCPATNWAPLAKSTLLGPPVDWLGLFTRLKGHDENTATVLRERPGQFFVALGLALQGVEQAAVAVNLAPPEKGSMLGVLSLSLTARRGPMVAWGLDLSDTALKALKLSCDPKTKALRIESCEYVPHSKPLTHPDAEMQRSEIVETTLQTFVERHDLKDTKICVGLSGRRVLGRFFDLPPMPAKKVPDAMLFEAQHQIPISLAELRWGYHIFEEAPGKGVNSLPRRAALIAARESHVQECLHPFKATGIAVDIVQSDCIALHNAAVFEFFPQAGESPASESGTAALEAASQAIVLVDIGAQSTNVVISSPRGMWFRSLGQGGDSFTKAVVQKFQVTHEQAELLVREPARARRYYQWREAIVPLFVQIGSEIERSLASYQKSASNRPIARIYGLGGGFQVHGLLRYLRAGK